jgi:hypothetical protein
LIFLPVQGFAGGVENWHVHMKGALNIALGLTEVLLSAGPYPAIGGSPRSPISSHDPETSLPFNEDEALLKFLISYTYG